MTLADQLCYMLCTHLSTNIFTPFLDAYGIRYTTLYQWKLLAQAPRGSSKCGVCQNDDASVFCATCAAVRHDQGYMCASCDHHAHTGMVCNPCPHARELLCSGRSLHPKERVSDPNAEGRRAITTTSAGVYLQRDAPCSLCGKWGSYTPDDTSKQIDSMCVITREGRFNIDRANIICSVCNGTLHLGDASTYMTRTTVPGTRLPPLPRTLM